MKEQKVTVVPLTQYFIPRALNLTESFKKLMSQVDAENKATRPHNLPFKNGAFLLQLITTILVRLDNASANSVKIFYSLAKNICHGFTVIGCNYLQSLSTFEIYF